MNRGLLVNVALDLADIHVRSMAESGWKAMVLGDDRIENILEHLIRVFVTSIDTAVLIVKLNSTSDSLGREPVFY